MARRDVARLLECQLLRRAGLFAVERCEQKADMVAEIMLLENRACEPAVARIEDRWAGEGTFGTRFEDPHHVYAADLDLFGKGSLFELLCTARTRMGERTLAEWLLAPANAPEVLERQAAARDLRDRLDLREAWAVIGDDDTVGARQ